MGHTHTYTTTSSSSLRRPNVAQVVFFWWGAPLFFVQRRGRDGASRSTPEKGLKSLSLISRHPAERTLLDID